MIIKREGKKEPERPEVMYAVMVPQKISDINIEQTGPPYLPLPLYVKPPDNEPFWYIPLFTTWEAAVKWNNGDTMNIVPCQTVRKELETTS